MNGKALATLGITLGFATLGHVALAQSTAEAPADFSPPRPATMQDPGIATGSATAMEQAPAPAMATSEPAPPAVIEEAPPAAPIEQADARATTRRAAPDRMAPRDRHDPNPQTGHYLGHGLFNNWGPNDFGA